MKRPARPAGRSAAIDARTRARRIANLRARHRIDREPEAVRDARLAGLAALCGKLERGRFDETELIEARAALAVSPAERQCVLPLHSGKRQ